MQQIISSGNAELISAVILNSFADIQPNLNLQNMITEVAPLQSATPLQGITVDDILHDNSL